MMKKVMKVIMSNSVIFLYLGIYMSDYIIVVITFDRVEKCYKKTLSFLKANDIPREKIYLVVHTNEEKEKYENGIPAEYYNQILISNSTDGCYGQMNYVFDYFEEGKHILKLDDDISNVYELEDDKLVNTKSLEQIIERGFKLCEEHNYKLWGLYPTRNPFYIKNQKNEYSTDLKFIVGAWMGIINEKIQIDLSIKIKGDYDYGIQTFLRNGGIIRFNKIGFKYDIAKNVGNRTETMINDANILISKYPNMIRNNNTRKKGEILYKSVKNFKVTDKEITEGQEVDKNVFSKLIGMLDKLKFTKRIKNNNRSNFPVHESAIFGIIRHRYKGTVGLSTYSLKHKEIYHELHEVAKQINPDFQFNAIHVNKNLVCPKHIDGHNVGKSLLISIGDYNGCNIVINNKKYDAKYKPIYFNGALLEHYNTDDLEGTKYSIIYYHNNYNLDL